METPWRMKFRRFFWCVRCIVGRVLGVLRCEMVVVFDVVWEGRCLDEAVDWWSVDCGLGGRAVHFVDLVFVCWAV